MITIRKGRFKEKFELQIPHFVRNNGHHFLANILSKLNVAMDLKSYGEIFCLQNDLPLFLIQISCRKANLEFNFYHIFQNIEWRTREQSEKWMNLHIFGQHFSDSGHLTKQHLKR